VTHEMGFARAAADEILFMDEGKIVEQASPHDLYNNPQEERTKLFLSQILQHRSRILRRCLSVLRGENLLVH
jgi:ABC-type glutathione transport system ATPase component